MVQKYGFPAGLDHILLGAPDLDAGMDLVERKLGVRPVRGGRHPDYGTHNAILSLGPTVYLEVIAPDPGLEPPARGVVLGLGELRAPKLVTWVLRDEEISAAAERARSAGIELGEVEAGGRRRPDGSTLSWRVTDPYASRLGGAVPFLISWGETPHPAVSAPPGGTLVGLRVEHDRAESVARSLSSLSSDVEVREADAFTLVATIRTPAGMVVLR